MIRDSLEREIRSRLGELTDGETFERCANALLSKDYPTLAPREGGNDAGLDGLIVDKDNRSIQLICTIGKDVIGNLTRSIESNVKSGGKCYASILATSKRLTNKTKRDLHDRARNLNRPLLQIYDEAAFAQLLYRNARWLKELLDLTGNPPSLSVFPISSRPLIDVPPLGRDADIAKLANLSGHTVLAGQPGSGKTHLLFTVAKKCKALFVVDEEIMQIANEVRSIQPRFLIVDDAHTRLKLLKRLIHLRREIGADYYLMASCWPCQEDALCAALQITKSQCHLLEGLNQKQIRNIIQSQGIFGPPDLVAEIIHQSQGKPGLAVTLCRLCLAAGVRNVVLGTALAEDIKQSFEPIWGPDATHLLALFSIGGTAGMTIASVARLMNNTPLVVRRLAEQLSAAGVLNALEEKITVEPLRLQQALVRDTFLTKYHLDLNPFLSETPDYEATTRVLIQAKALGGILSDKLLRERLMTLKTWSNNAFNDYVHLGREEAEWVLDTFPEKLNAVAAVTLEITAEKTIEMLLDAALKVYKEKMHAYFPQRSSDMLPELKHWILSAKPNSPDVVQRRRNLAKTLASWFQRNKSQSIAVFATSLVLSIKYEDTSTPPGEFRNVIFHAGVTEQQHLGNIAALWQIVSPILHEADLSEGCNVADIFHTWIFPDFMHRGLDKEYVKESRKHARSMMSDLLRAFTGKWTHHHHLRRYAVCLGLEKLIESDPVAEVLFPSREHTNWRKAQSQQMAAANKLADEWSARDPQIIVKLLISIDAQSQLAHLSCTRWDGYVCRRIAETTNKVTSWTQVFFTNIAPAHLIEPFLDVLSKHNKSIAATWVSKAIEMPSLRCIGVSTVITHYPPTSPLWLEASSFFSAFLPVIGTCILQKKVPEKNIKALIRFNEPVVATVAAINLWNANMVPRIPRGVFENWKNAILKSDSAENEHHLQCIFNEYPDLAFQWIAKQLDDINSGTKAISVKSNIGRILPPDRSVMSKHQRRLLIDKISQNTGDSELTHALVAWDMELYDYLLSRKDLGNVRLDPLRVCNDSNQGNTITDFDERWQSMAIAAMQKGFSVEDIFWATQGGNCSWSGSWSEMYAAKMVPFEKLAHHSEPCLRKVGEFGASYFAKHRDDNLDREKRVAVRGEVE
jgi:hypothetical protein